MCFILFVNLLFVSCQVKNIAYDLTPGSVTEGVACTMALFLSNQNLGINHKIDTTFVARGTQRRKQIVNHCCPSYGEGKYRYDGSTDTKRYEPTSWERDEFPPFASGLGDIIQTAFVCMPREHNNKASGIIKNLANGRSS